MNHDLGLVFAGVVWGIFIGLAGQSLVTDLLWRKWQKSGRLEITEVRDGTLLFMRDKPNENKVQE